MGAPRPPLDISSKEVIRLMRAWGWTFVAEGVKEATFKHKDGNRLSIKRKDKADADPVVEAARIQGITMEEWLKGPEARPEPTDISSEDLQWFLDHEMSDFDVGTPSLGRWRTIRDELQKQGLLHHYKRAARRALEVKVPEPAPVAPVAPEPLDVEVDQEGWITLDTALAMRGLKQNLLSRSSCELITILAHFGTIEDSKGKATPKLLAMMPSHYKDKPLMGPGLSGLIQQWEKAGLIWREMPHARATSKIGLCMPVKVSSNEKALYLRDVDAKRDFFGITEDAADILAERIEIEEQVSVPNAEELVLIPTNVPKNVTVNTAIEILEAEARDLQARLDHLHYAIDILKNH